MWTFFNVFSCQRSTPRTEKKETAAEEKRQIDRAEQINLAILKMVAKYNAITDWKKGFAEKMVRGIYTIEMEEALVRKDGRAVLFFGSVSDIMRRDNKYFIHFWNWLDFPSLDIRFVLECDSVKVKKVMDQSNSIFDEFAVVALISSVQKAMFEVRAESESDEEANIVVEPSDVFIAKGRCLDLLFVGDLGMKRE